MKQINLSEIVIMGDSNTEGFGIPDSINHYPNILQTILKNQVNVYNMGVTSTCVINTTLPDGTVVGMPYVHQEKYQQALKLNGDIYIINLGTNDGQDGMDDVTDIRHEESNLIAYLDYFEADYVAIVNAIKTAHPGAIIMICKPIPVLQCIWRKHQQHYMDMILPIFDKILSTDSSLILIDLYQYFTSMCTQDMLSLYQKDGLHLNEKGTALVAHYMAERIKNTILS